MIWKDSPTQAAEKIIEFINDRHKLEAASRAAKKLALHQFSRDILANQFEQVLQYAVSAEGKSPQQITSEFYD